MLGRTHRAGGVAACLVGFEVMRHKGLLIPDVHPLLQLAVMYPVAQWSSTLPDLDHHWESVGGKTPVSWLLHKVLHLSRPKHRSWQTHSLLVTGSFLALLYAITLLGNETWQGSSVTDWALVRLLIYGFILGVGSHLFLDAINPSGIHTIPGHKIRFVPRTAFFATDGKWENHIVYPACMVLSAIAALSIFFGVFEVSLWEQAFGAEGIIRNLG